MLTPSLVSATETIVTYLYDTLDRYEIVIVDLLKALHRQVPATIKLGLHIVLM